MGSFPAGRLPAQGFLWNDGNVIPLGKPASATNSTANAISNNGVICGYYSIADPQGTGGYKRRALAWIKGQMIDLGTLSGFLQSRATALNDSGVIVGYADNPPLLGNGVKGFVWRSGQMIAIAELLAPQYSQYQVRYTYGINNNGEIAAVVKSSTASDPSAAVLTPLPPHPGDTNCDWLTNIDDLVNVITAWGTSPAPQPFSGSPDLNDNGTVNIDDLVLVVVNWG
jgi:probable HAF family extracellular repeat protein